MPLGEIERLLQNEIGLHSSTVGSDTVRHAVEARMRACDISRVEDYRDVIRHSRTELDQLIDTVVIPETWFFRDHNPFSAFSEWLQESRRGRNTPTPLRILSVPCSTGEEPYTLAMCLADCGIAPSQAHIDAIDISSVNLAIARNAEYGINSFRSHDLSFRERHFDAVGQRYRLRDDIRARVRFTRANILDSEFLAGCEAYHVIFCRNLLIYFDRATQHQAIDNLCKLLVERGLLFLGHSETSLLKDRPFTAMAFPRSFGFVHRQPVDQPEAVPEFKKPRRPAYPPAPASQKQKPTMPFAGVRPETKPHDNTRRDSDPLQTAFRLADEGHLDEAALQCEALMKQDSCQPGPYYLLGLVREATGNSSAAEQLFRKAVYLAPDHYEALTHLSVICERKGDKQSAQRFRDRAQRIQATAPLRHIEQ
ncbi:MAG: hypothetical protein J5I92_17150 [Thiogranum sp.]|nr:hypothetical protein [Thiogranum sp.]